MHRCFVKLPLGLTQSPANDPLHHLFANDHLFANSLLNFDLPGGIRNEKSRFNRLKAILINRRRFAEPKTAILTDSRLPNLRLSELGRSLFLPPISNGQGVRMDFGYRCA